MNKFKFFLATVLMISVVSCSEVSPEGDVTCTDSLSVDTTKTCCDTVVSNPTDEPVLDTIVVADPR